MNNLTLSPDGGKTILMDTLTVDCTRHWWLNACIASFSAGRNHCSKPAPANRSQDPILKIFNTKKCWRLAQVVEHLTSNPTIAQKKR
jgi:hypothetical protein